MITYLSGDGIGKQTANANTAIQVLIGGLRNLFTHLTNFNYTPGATSHTLTVMRAQQTYRATIQPGTTPNGSIALAAGGTLLYVGTNAPGFPGPTLQGVVASMFADKQGNPPASPDILGILLSDDTWMLNTISAWDAINGILTLNTPITANKNVLIGAPVALFGQAADAYHAANTFPLATGSTTNLPPTNVLGDDSVTKSSYRGIPLLLNVDNITNQGTLNSANFAFSKQ